MLKNEGGGRKKEKTTPIGGTEEGEERGERKSISSFAGFLFFLSLFRGTLRHFQKRNRLPISMVGFSPLFFF